MGERCIRWPLLRHARVGRGESKLTQYFLGQMPGVGSPPVKATAQAP